MNLTYMERWRPPSLPAKPAPVQLDLLPLEYPESTGLTVAQRFAAFHAANPQVYRAIVKLARHVKARGNRTGMKAIFERLRWESDIETDGEAWKLNNSYTRYYARLIMEREPDLRGFFEVRGDGH